MKARIARSCIAATLLVTFAAAARGDEWGTIKGRFVFGGEAPAAAELKADKDIEVCGKHKLLAEELVVGGDKGVANVVVFVRTPKDKDKELKVNPGLKSLAEKSAILDNKNCRFEPHVLMVQVGQELVIKNSDTVSHNSNIAAIKNTPENPQIPAGDQVRKKFTTEEPLPIQVSCNIHPWMKAFVVVRPNPYAAVSASDGSFEIKDLPVGDIELQLWHEKAGYLKDVSFSADGKTEKADSKGRLKLKIDPKTCDLGSATLGPALFSK